MSTYSRFKKFCEEKLAINNRGVIAKRRKAITKRLNKEFWHSESETKHSFYVGSDVTGAIAIVIQRDPEVANFCT
jgi:hypothetical protein